MDRVGNGKGMEKIKGKEKRRKGIIKQCYASLKVKLLLMPLLCTPLLVIVILI